MTLCVCVCICVCMCTHVSVRHSHCAPTTVLSFGHTHDSLDACVWERERDQGCVCVCVLSYEHVISANSVDIPYLLLPTFCAAPQPPLLHTCWQFPGNISVSIPTAVGVCLHVSVCTCMHGQVITDNPTPYTLSHYFQEEPVNQSSCSQSGQALLHAGWPCMRGTPEGFSWSS